MNFDDTEKEEASKIVYKEINGLQIPFNEKGEQLERIKTPQEILGTENIKYTKRGLISGNDRLRVESYNRAGGQPTKYREEYCDMLIEHMSKGFSFESFAAKISVAEDTAQEWSLVHAKFSAAKSVGLSKSRLRMEEIALGVADGKIEKGSSTMTIFILKNRFPREWKDRIHSSENNPSQIVFKVSSDNSENAE